ncbi:MAG: TerB family tellurite resistance protein [Chitinophagaceae bacterium]|nr:TerB family tellurite resistance protein [Chitinophagaceae bacterium]
MDNILDYIKVNPLQDRTEEEKVTYLCVLSSIALADGKILEEEIKMMNKFCDISNISQKTKSTVVEFMKNQNNEKDMQQYIQKLAVTDLRHSLIVNMFFLAFSDHLLDSQELRKIKNIAKSLNLTIEEVQNIKKYVKFAIKARIGKRV